MTPTLKLEIVTPHGTVFSEDVEMVTLPPLAIASLALAARLTRT